MTKIVKLAWERDFMVGAPLIEFQTNNKYNGKTLNEIFDDVLGKSTSGFTLCQINGTSRYYENNDEEFNTVFFSTSDDAKLAGYDKNYLTYENLIAITEKSSYGCIIVF